MIRNSVLMALTLAMAYTADAQLKPGYFYKDINSAYHVVDSMLRLEIGEGLPDSYFVITYPAAGAVTTFAPQFIKAYRAMASKGVGAEQIVIAFLTEGGIRRKDLPLFMAEALGLSEEEAKATKYSTSPDVYSCINGRGALSRLLYVYRRAAFSCETIKWNSIEAAEAPRQAIRVSLENRIRLPDVEGVLLFQRDPLFEYNEEALLVLTDVRDGIYRLDTKTGALAPIFFLGAYKSATDLYCELFARDTGACEFARRHEHLATRSKRQTVNIDNITYSEDEIIGSFSVEVFEEGQKYKFTNDEGQKVKIKKGQPSLNAYFGIFTYNIRSGHLEVDRLLEPRQKRKREVYVMTSNGMLAKGGQITAPVQRYPGKGTSKSLCTLQRGRNGFEVVGFMPPKLSKEEEALLDGYGTRAFFIEFNTTAYLLYDMIGKVYELGRENPVSTLYGDGSAPYPKIVYRKYNEEAIEERLNFDIFAANSIIGGKYLLIAYRYKDNLVLDVKNSLLKTVDILEMSSIPGLGRFLSPRVGGSLLIANDKIYFLTIEDDDEYHLNIYAIKEE